MSDCPSGNYINDLRDEIKSLKSELEQERTKHAGCLSASEGYFGDTKEGDYGWSQANQSVADLYQRCINCEHNFNVLHDELDDVTNAHKVSDENRSKAMIENQRLQKQVEERGKRMGIMWEWCDHSMTPNRWYDWFDDKGNCL